VGNELDQTQAPELPTIFHRSTNVSTAFSGRGEARRVPSIFCRSTNVSTERHTMRGLRLPAWPGGGGRAAGQPPVGQPPFLEGLLAGIAGAKDLVGGAEDALGGSLGECLALAP